MEYTYLKNGFKVSLASFGCMSLSPSAHDNDIIIGKAIDKGINLFDTADLYDKGENEIVLGKALRGKRQDVLVSTKVGNKWRADGSGWDWTPRKDYILKAVDNSLSRLGTDYIDLYLLHGGTIEDPVDEVIEAFENLKTAGKIRSYGLSSIRPNVIREFVKRSDISAVMTQYSLLDTRPEEETLRLLENNNIGVLARGTLASGLLAGKPAKPYLGMEVDKVKEIQEGLLKNLPDGYTEGEAAIRYVIDCKAVASAVVGIRTLRQLNEVTGAVAHNPLTPQCRKRLQEIAAHNRYTEHL